MQLQAKPGGNPSKLAARECDSHQSTNPPRECKAKPPSLEGGFTVQMSSPAESNRRFASSSPASVSRWHSPVYHKLPFELMFFCICLMQGEGLSKTPSASPAAIFFCKAFAVVGPIR